jgi:uncharacterized protein
MTEPLTLLRPRAGEPLSVILKLPGETCNINCYYCYEKRKPYPNALQLKPDVLERFLALFGDRTLRVELHGGEPLLVKRHRMAELLGVLRRYPGAISLSIQTNGVLLDDAWVRFFLDEWPDIDLGVSLDGDARANALRVDYHDRNTTEAVEAALERLGRSELNVGVIATVTSRSLGRAAELVQYFAGFEAIRFLKLGACLDFNVRTKSFPKGNRESLLVLNASGEGVPRWATSPLEYADFVIEAYEEWRTGPYQHFVIEPIFSLIQALAGRQPSFCHFSDAKCAHVLTLYPDGRIGSCDELQMPHAYLAHLDELTSIDEVIRMQTNQTLAMRLTSLFDKCNSCSYRPTCRGGCLATRLRYQGTPLDDEYCGYRARLIDYVAESIGAGRHVETAPAR